MPRIREIKPDFFLDEHLAECSMAARLLFVGLWTLCDREGRLEDRPARIKAQVFPYGQEDVEVLLAELAAHPHGFIRRYDVDGKAFIEVRSFCKHQRPHPKETASRLPAPPPLIGAVELHGKSRKATTSRESPTCQVDPSGGSMGTWAHGHMGHGVLPAPPAPAPLTPVDPVEASVVEAPVSPLAPPSWSRQACDDWIGRYGGTAPGGQIGKALKPLVAKHGWPAVRQAWRSYLEQSDAEYASASRFAATYGRWSGAAPPGKARPAAVVDHNRAVLERFVKGGEAG